MVFRKHETDGPCTPVHSSGQKAFNLEHSETLGPPEALLGAHLTGARHYREGQIFGQNIGCPPGLILFRSAMCTPPHPHFPVPTDNATDG